MFKHTEAYMPVMRIAGCIDIAVGSGSTDLNRWEEVEARQRLGTIDTRQREILADG